MEIQATCFSPHNFHGCLVGRLNREAVEKEAVNKDTSNPYSSKSLNYVVVAGEAWVLISLKSDDRLMFRFFLRYQWTVKARQTVEC